MIYLLIFLLFFFFNDTATTEIYTSINTLSLHDALPIRCRHRRRKVRSRTKRSRWCKRSEEHTSELQSPIDISYAVFCLKKKKSPTQTWDRIRPRQPHIQGSHELL